MCIKCRIEAARTMAAVFTLAGTTHENLPIFSERGGEGDGLLFREIVTMFTECAAIDPQHPTMTDEAARAIQQRLRDMPADTLNEVSIFCDAVGEFFTAHQDVARVILAQRAMSGEEAARRWISPRAATNVLAGAALYIARADAEDEAAKNAAAGKPSPFVH